MCKSMLLRFSFLVAGLVSGGTASFASPCLAIDQSNDTLTEQERKAAINTFQAVLERQDFKIEGCEPFILTHSRLGEVVTIRVIQGSESRTLRAASLSDLPAAYDQIVISLISGKPIEASVRRDNVMQSQATREKESIDSIFFLGFSGSGASNVERVMPGFHLSAQFQTDAHTFGFSGGLLVGPSETTDSAVQDVEDDAARAFFGLDYAFFLSPLEASSFYVGTGLGYEGDVAGSLSGVGFYLSPTVGMEFFRTSAARVGVELKSTLPLYQLSGDGQDSEWNPALSLILKIGWDVPPEWILFSLLAR